MKLSHSKLSTLVSNPKKYKAIYKLGFKPKEKTSALTIGSAVHWGIEHDTYDLQPYFDESGTFFQSQQYTYEQLLSESMVYGYLKNKDKIMKDILTDIETGEPLELIEELHEVTLTASLPSNIEGAEPHSFVGVIDLLLLTNKGFIVLDYKTSRYKPQFDDYLEQIYRYIFLLNSEFPDVPVYKVGIINLRKASIRQKKTESEYAFLQRLKMEYELNEDAYINHYIYTEDVLDKELRERYIKNLADMADFAEHVDSHNLYWWNYSDIWGKEYYGICHNIKDAYLLFDISDTIFDDEKKIFEKYRSAKEIDMLAINQDNVLHKYEQFETQAVAYFAVHQDVTKEKLFAHIKQNFVCDEDLLEQHWVTLQAKLEGYADKTESENVEKEIDDEE